MIAGAHAQRWPRVRAPGKVVLAGEYGVLEGGRALVMAVDRLVHLSGSKPAPETDLEREGLARLAGLGLGALPPGVPRVDSDALFDGPRKLGLGSSAAWTAAVVGSALAALGEDLADAEVRTRAVRLGRVVHGGGGSGADVAASVLGGVVSYRLVGEGFEARRVDLPETHRPLVVGGPEPVSTARAVAAMRAEAHAALMAEAVHAGDALHDALLDPGRALAPAVREAARVLDRIALAVDLGAGAGRETVAAADAVAYEFNGAAKPSGAGGGDLVLVFVPEVDPRDRRRVAASLRGRGLYVLDLELEGGGVSAE